MTVRQYLQVKYFCNYISTKLCLGAIIGILFNICILILAFDAIAQPIELSLNNLSPLKLINTDNKICASGFLFGSKIITNYHVANSLCPEASCSNLRIFSETNENSVATELKIEGNTKISRGASAAAYDIGILEINGRQEDQNASIPTALNIRDYADPGKENSQLLSFSFPNCQKLAVSPGDNLSTIGSLYFRTSLHLKHGSSGGPIFDKTGRLIGIISESDTFLNGASSMLFGTTFEATRAVPAQRLNELLTLDSNSIFSAEVASLLEFYSETVIKKTGMQRVEESSRFLSKTKAMALDNISNQKGAAAILVAIDNYPFPLFTSTGWGLEDLKSSSVALALAASLEQFGLRSSLTSYVNQEQLNHLKVSLLQRFPSDSKSILNFLTSIERSGYPGATFYLIKIFMPSLIIIAIALALWLLGIGAFISRPKLNLTQKSFRVIIWSLGTILLLLSLLVLTYPI